MRTLFLLLFPLLFLSGCGDRHNQSAEEFSSPKNIVARLGKIEQHTSKDHKFVLKNNTGSAMEVTSMVMSCGCTHAVISNDHLRPGEVCTVLATLSAQDRIGEFSSSIKIYWRTVGSNINKLKTVFLEATAVSELMLSEESVDLGTMSSRDSEISHSITIHRGEADIDWDNLSANATRLSATTTKQTNDQYQLNLVVHPDRFRSLGTFTDTVVIRLFDKGNEVGHAVALPVSGRIASDVTSVPFSVFLGLIRHNESRSGQIVIKCSKSVRIDRLPDPIVAGAVSLKARWLTRNQEIGIISYKIEGAKEMAGSLKAVIRIPLEGSPSGRELEVPVIGYIQ